MTGDDYLMIERLLGDCGIEVSAAEADGRLLSLASMMGADALTIWIQQLLEGAESGQQQAVTQLQEFGARRMMILEQREGLPDLCLPDDEDDLRDRVSSLALWVTGFLNGLGEAAALSGDEARTALKAEPLAEMLIDLTEISRASIETEEIAADENESEIAYAEVVEFVRVAAQLAYETLAALRDTEAPPPQVH